MSVFGERTSISNLEEEPLLYEHPHTDTTGDHIENEREVRHIEVFLAIVILVFAVLIGKLFLLQVVGGASNLKLAEGNRIFVRTLPAPRGLMYDRDNKPLVKNVARYELIITPADLPKNKQERESIYSLVRDELHIDMTDISKQIESKGLYSIDPIFIQDNISQEQALTYQVILKDSVGVEVIAEPIRSYPISESMGHILGYIGKVSQDELASNNAYLLTDWVGKTGLEKKYEDVIKGIHGQEQVEIDAKGRLQRIVASTHPEQGNNLKTTIDSPLQSVTFQSLSKTVLEKGNGKGAAIALNPNTGEVYALVSLPEYDLNTFIRGKKDELASLFNDPEQPLLNRVIAGTYPSGSSIKPIYAAAGLQEKVITADSAIETPDAIRIGDFTFPDWKKHDGKTNVKRAIAESNNIFFYALGGGYDSIRGIGIKRMDDYLIRFGFGSPTGIDISHEGEGFVPTPDWKKQKKKEPWYIGDTYHLAIGQDDLSVTPIQLAIAESTVVNGGTRITPHIVTSVTDIHGKEIQKVDPSPKSNNVIDSANAATVRSGMRMTVESGSARSILADLKGNNGQPIESAGKTGTAQTGHGDSTHAWYVGYAPYDNPQILVVVLAEEGGEGFSTAAPVAGEMFKAFFRDK